MLKLVKEKENLLVEKYGFVKFTDYDDYRSYQYKNIWVYGRKINRLGKDYSYTVQISSLSNKTQDLIYDLIVDGVLVKHETNEKDIQLKRIEKKESQIKKLQDEIRKIQSEIEE
jgi:hypothetical protein